jgi:hypothetical protein
MKEQPTDEQVRQALADLVVPPRRYKGRFRPKMPNHRRPNTVLISEAIACRSEPVDNLSRVEHLIDKGFS